MAMDAFNKNADPFDDTDLGLRIGKKYRIIYDPKIQVTTSDRRVKGRIWKYYMSEWLPSYLNIIVLKKNSQKCAYQDIR
jgi:hypothetical protein